MPQDERLAASHLLRALPVPQPWAGFPDWPGAVVSQTAATSTIQSHSVHKPLGTCGKVSSHTKMCWRGDRHARLYDLGRQRNIKH